MAGMDFSRMHAQVHFVSNFDRALKLAASLAEAATPSPSPPAGAE